MINADLAPRASTDQQHADGPQPVGRLLWFLELVVRQLFHESGMQARSSSFCGHDDFFMLGGAVAVHQRRQQRDNLHQSCSSPWRRRQQRRQWVASDFEQEAVRLAIRCGERLALSRERVVRMS